MHECNHNTDPHPNITFRIFSSHMAAHIRLARRRAQNAAALTRSAQVENLMQCRSVQKLDIDQLDASFKSSRARQSGLSRILRGGERKRTKKSPARETHERTELVPSSGQLEAKTKDFRTLCRRLRKLPLRQLAPSLPALHLKVQETMAPNELSLFWSSISRRVLVNSGDFPLISLAYVLPELQRAGHLAKVSALGKLVRGLARQTAALKFSESQSHSLEKEMAFRELLPLLMLENHLAIFWHVLTCSAFVSFPKQCVTLRGSYGKGKAS